MNQVEIKATFSGVSAAHEALHKLQALRVVDVGGLYEQGLLTATVDEEIADKARHLIEQIGGQVDTSII
ncbi:hypothetical protein [Paenibacillus harenae]|uniref:Uncharacterized protein n=1 Tax=Paenibacillus harenae TaxID=306543 RepID=A0ABT9TYA4_PAEHA|nr:hypothetical protein [Paenibacillus harenae]MDQ0111728.1 hypothetical protein [Paenibacillus harenae]